MLVSVSTLCVYVHVFLLVCPSLAYNMNALRKLALRKLDCSNNNYKLQHDVCDLIGQTPRSRHWNRAHAYSSVT